jgi:hypothetical protein
MYKCEYFAIQELVSPVVYNKWGQQAWMFFDEDVLRELDLIRENLGAPIIINNWHNKGSLKQCGLRSNLDEIPKTKTLKNNLYLSFHTMGKAFDLHNGFGNHRKLYDVCYELIKKGKLKKFNRLENFNNTLCWVHIDCANTDFTIFS